MRRPHSVSEIDCFAISICCAAYDFRGVLTAPDVGDGIIRSFCECVKKVDLAFQRVIAFAWLESYYTDLVLVQ